MAFRLTQETHISYVLSFSVSENIIIWFICVSLQSTFQAIFIYSHRRRYNNTFFLGSTSPQKRDTFTV